MRVITGKAKGIKLQAPEKGTRPLTDRIKTSIFDLIRDFIPEANVLDLYAGSGNFGIEALSRGASSATFVDLGSRAVELIEENLRNTGLTDQSKIVQEKVNDFVVKTESQNDIIFLDPPFDSDNNEDFRALAKILSKEGILIYRIPSNKSKLEFNYLPLKIVYEKQYGKSIVRFLKILPDEK